MVRLARVLFVVLTALVVPAMGERAAMADQRSDIAVGTSLQATSNVTLHKAEIAKGSRVHVTKIQKRGDHVEGISVALADGHVVKVTLAQVHTYFRVVQD